MKTTLLRVCARALVGMAAAVASVSAAAAQTTVTLNDSGPDVVSATVRGGTYANTNLSNVLTTRAADSASNHQRALLKFDTQNRIPAGSNVTSALLTLTVKSGSAADTTRTIGAYQLTTSWLAPETTWNHRWSSSSWMTPGGDLGSLITRQVVSNVAGTKVTFDVTALVKSAVAGNLGSSRYTRIALVDLDAATVDSTRNYYTPSEANSSLRPTLKVVYGSSVTTTGTGSGSTTLRVLQWNSQHGGTGTDGVLDPARFIRKAASFHPDVFSINEVERFDSYANYDAPVKLHALMEQYTGQTWYYRFTVGSGATNGRGNMILSRFPIQSSGVRLLGHNDAAIDVVINVNGRTIDFTSTHLYYQYTSVRLDQIDQLVSWENGLPQSRIIAGDFNAGPSSSETARMDVNYIDSWAQAQRDGTVITYAGNTAGYTRHTRIDYIFYSKAATGLRLVSSQVFDVADANGVMPSDHRPLMTVFELR